MDIERIELLTTLKGSEIWKKGTILDVKKDGPFPPEIIAEVRANTGTVRVLKAISSEASPQPVFSIETKINEGEARLAELQAKIAKAEAKLMDMELSNDEEEQIGTSLTGGDILRMTHDEILDLLKNEEDFESLKDQKRTVLVGIASKRFVKNDQS